MALVSCHECGAKVSDEANACPQCGVKPKAKTSLFTKIVGGFFALTVASAIIGQNSNSPPAAPPAPKKPADPLAEARFQRTVLVARSIKAALRNPDSVQWVSFHSDDEANLVCIEYRAQNGFGGMNLEQAAYAKGKIQTSTAAWNKHCGGKRLNNLRHVKYAL